MSLFSLSNEQGLHEALLSSTLGNLLPHGGIHSLFLALGIPSWLPRHSMCGKSTSSVGRALQCYYPTKFPGTHSGAAKSFSKSMIIAWLELHKSIMDAVKI